MDKVVSVLKALLISIAAIFAPIHSLLVSTGVLIFADLVTGVMAARKSGIPITSSGLRRTISKLFVYEAALMLAYLAEHYISDVLPFVKMASATVSLVELTSVYENLNAISGSNLLKSLIDKLGSTNQTPS